QRKALGDEGLEGPLAVESIDLALRMHHAGWVDEVIESPVQPEDAVVLHEQVVCSHLGEAPVGEAHHEDTPLEGDALGRALEDGAAHWIEDHVRAPTQGCGLDDRDEVLRIIVDRDLGPELTAELSLLRASCGGDDFGAKRLS